MCPVRTRVLSAVSAGVLPRVFGSVLLGVFHGVIGGIADRGGDCRTVEVKVEIEIVVIAIVILVVVLVLVLVVLGRIALRLLQEADRDASVQRATGVDPVLESLPQDTVL